MQPEASSDAGRGAVRSAASAACVAASVVSADPVRIEVVGVRMEGGHAVLSLSREHSTAWMGKFVQVISGGDFRERVPDGWLHKGERGVSVLGFALYRGVLQVENVPSDEASFRQLMVAVRYALEQTNAAEPAEDPPIADSSLTPVLEEVFQTAQVGAASEPT